MCVFAPTKRPSASVMRPAEVTALHRLARLGRRGDAVRACREALQGRLLESLQAGVAAPPRDAIGREALEGQHQRGIS
eukprot:15480279-Alexandrium_andersonii.AAC.1